MVIFTFVPISTLLLCDKRTCKSVFGVYSLISEIAILCSTDCREWVSSIFYTTDYSPTPTIHMFNLVVKKRDYTLITSGDSHFVVYVLYLKKSQERYRQSHFTNQFSLWNRYKHTYHICITYIYL